MRIEKVYDKLYIYLDKLYVDCDYSDKKSVGEFVKDYLVHYQYNPLENKFEFDQLETFWRGGVPGKNPFIRRGCCSEDLD